jgi:hypothetical protein
VSCGFSVAAWVEDRDPIQKKAWDAVHRENPSPQLSSTLRIGTRNRETSRTNDHDRAVPDSVFNRVVSQ